LNFDQDRFYRTRKEDSEDNLNKTLDSHWDYPVRNTLKKKALIKLASQEPVIQVSQKLNKRDYFLTKRPL